MTKKLVVTALGGRIVYGNILKDGYLGNQQIEMTEDVLRATNEWFIINKKKMYGHTIDSTGVIAYVFHTTDESKKERILTILEEDDAE